MNLGTGTVPRLRALAVGETLNDWLCIDARKHWNPSGLKLRAGECYEFKIEDVKDWRDWFIRSDPQVGHLKSKWLSWLVWVFMKPPIKLLRRYRKANWYTLVGTAGKCPRKYFLIGRGRSYTPKTTGELFTFANDARGSYWNNHGTLRLKVTRLS